MGDLAEKRSYVVHLIETEDPHPFKYFTSRSDASDWARQQVKAEHAERANVYKVSAIDAREGVSIVKDGRGELVESANPHAAEAQVSEAFHRAYENATKGDENDWRKFVAWMFQRKQS